jgi:uncharacterized membrane protein
MDHFLSDACYTAGVGFKPDLRSVIDWGYSDNGNFPVNIPLNAMLLRSLRAIAAVAAALSDAASHDKYQAALAAHTQTVLKTLGIARDGPAAAGPGADVAAISEDWVVVDTVDFERIGFHGTALLLQAGGVFDDVTAPQASQFLERTLNSMFPINSSAPRLSDPSKHSTTGFYTPYFQTFTFEGLFEAGAADVALSQIRQAWGWAMQQSSTWLEVFDVRWEAVHSWYARELPARTAMRSRLRSTLLTTVPISEPHAIVASQRLCLLPVRMCTRSAARAAS